MLKKNWRPDPNKFATIQKLQNIFYQSDQIVKTAILDESLMKSAEVNPEDKFELVFKNLLEKIFIERIDQNEDIFARYMNDA